jgi:hypothetical protein
VVLQNFFNNERIYLFDPVSCDTFVTASLIGWEARRLEGFKARRLTHFQAL